MHELYASGDHFKVVFISGGGSSSSSGGGSSSNSSSSGSSRTYFIEKQELHISAFN